MPGIKKIEPVVWLYGFGSKLSRRSKFAPGRPSFLQPNQNFLADPLLLIIFIFLRFCTKYPHLLQQYLFISLIVQNEIANNAIKAHRSFPKHPAVSPNKVFP